MLEETREPDPVVRNVWLLAYDDDVVLARSGVELEQFLAVRVLKMRWLVLPLHR